MPPKTLTRNVKLILPPFRKPGKEFLDQFVIVHGGPIVADLFVTFGSVGAESYSGGLFDVEDVGCLIPGVGVGTQDSVWFE